jgi:predicted polyphosphate/ATP-dependent NAD kinase
LKPIGIIANPASGKDIRRLVAYGSVFDNVEKTNIVKRILLALNALEVRDVFIMPDSFGIGRRAIEDIDVSVEARLLDMQLRGTADDSQQAAEILAGLDVACIITLGGDGTNRVVAKSCGNTAILPISTGTNNVFPYMIEGTLAGMAAAILATREYPRDQALRQMPQLEIYRSETLLDIALIDIVVTDDSYVGAKAVWEVDSLKEIFLSRISSASIGYSSLGGILGLTPSEKIRAAHIRIGAGDKEVLAPIAPGVIEWIPIASCRQFNPQDEIPINIDTGNMIALDGEREIEVYQGEKLTVRLNPAGPWVIDVDKVLSMASINKHWVSNR